ncbi:MAG: hemolysin family protein [Treponema sp.]|nr:hemolysin family protein [Treponema sp.]
MENILSPSLLTYFIIFLLILTGGVFSLFDYAISYCRKSRLEKENAKRFKAILKTLEDQSDQKQLWYGKRNLCFACRVWCNILRIFAAFAAGMTCVDLLSQFENIPSWIIVIIYALLLGLFTAFLSDAIPRLISRIKPEATASILLPAIKIICTPVMPFTLSLLKFVSFFKTAINPEKDESSITEEELQDELRNTLLEGEKSGIVEGKELSMVEGVFYLGDRSVAAFMKHRSEIQWLDINSPYEEIRAKVIEYKSQRCFPVADGNPDEITGAVYLEDIILDFSEEKPKGLRAIIKKAQFVPETMTALKAFESFKHGQVDFLFVMDEYGGLAGIISVRTLVEEIVGELSAPAASDKPFIKQEDGSYLADGTLNIDDAAHELSLNGLSEEGDFHTLAGLILHLAGELPHVGDSYEYQGYKFTVVDKDGNRIDKLLIKKIIE